MLFLGQGAENFDIIVSVTHCTGTVALANQSAVQLGSR